MDSNIKINDSIQQTLHEFVQSLDFNETDDLLIDEISNYKSHIKLEKLVSKLPNGGRIMEFQQNKESTNEYDMDECNDEIDNPFSYDDINHNQKEKHYFDMMVGKMEDISSGNGGVFKKIMHNGDGQLCPKNALCRVHYSAFLRDEIDPFDSSVSRGKHHLIKVGNDENGLPGLLIGIKTMQKGEVSQFLVTPDYAYGSLGCPPRIPPNSHILFEVEMLGFIDRTSLIDYINTMENIDQNQPSINDIIHVANTLVLEGNDYFKNNNLNSAIRCYGKALRLSESCNLSDNDEENSLNELHKRIFLNVALCCIALKKYTNAIDMCYKVLDIEPKNLKANFRLGHIYKSIGEFEKSTKYLNKCLKISPNNLSISNEVKNLDLLMGQCNKHIESFSQKMFGYTNTESTVNNMVKLQKFTKSSLFQQNLYDHFMDKLVKFKNVNTHNELHLPNNFNNIELKHLQHACIQLCINMEIDNAKNIIKLFK